MSIYIAHPTDQAQEAAVKAILEALKVPYETQATPEDDTAYLLSSEANKKRLQDAMANEGKGSRSIGLDEIWK